MFPAMLLQPEERFSLAVFGAPLSNWHSFPCIGRRGEEERERESERVKTRDGGIKRGGSA